MATLFDGRALEAWECVVTGPLRRPATLTLVVMDV